MAFLYRAAVVSFMEELADDSIPQEARSCEDEEFLSFLLITSREMQSHGPIDLELFETYYTTLHCFRLSMSFSNVTCLKCLLATSLGLPHGQRNWGRPTIDL